MVKHHLIISGTGRAGTTFLVQLLTGLGVDTGFDDPQSSIFPYANAGMEFDIHSPNLPYVVKSPWLCDTIEDWLRAGDVIIDHAIIPIRDLYSAAESRRDVTRRTPSGLYSDGAPGGLWHTDIPELQEFVLTIQLYKLIYTITKRDIPHTTLYFPRLVEDRRYLYEKIRFVLNGIDYETFSREFDRWAKPHSTRNFLGEKEDQSR